MAARSGLKSTKYRFNPKPHVTSSLTTVVFKQNYFNESDGWHSLNCLAKTLLFRAGNILKQPLYFSETSPCLLWSRAVIARSLETIYRLFSSLLAAWNFWLWWRTFCKPRHQDGHRQPPHENRAAAGAAQIRAEMQDLGWERAEGTQRLVERYTKKSIINLVALPVMSTLWFYVTSSRCVVIVDIVSMSYFCRFVWSNIEKNIFHLWLK